MGAWVEKNLPEWYENIAQWSHRRYFRTLEVATVNNHDKMVSLKKTFVMRVLSERQDTNDGTGISCLGHRFNASYIG
jgi:hypothetical protein